MTPSLDQPRGVELPGRRMARDRAVHQRLGKRRLVALVVTVPAVAEQVDDDVLVKFAAVFGGGAGDFDDRFGIVAIDVKDRRLHRLGDVGGVGARPRRRRGGGKADLVVDDHMDRAAGAKTGQLGQFERFGDEPLPGEGGVAMHQDAGDLAALAVAALLLLGPDLAEHDRIDGFEMRRVGGQGQMDGLAADLAVGRGAEMVFDVARAMDMLGIGRIALEIRKRSRRMACRQNWRAR